MNTPTSTFSCALATLPRALVVTVDLTATIALFTPVQVSYNTAAANRAMARLVETGIGGALNPANADLAPPGDSKGTGAGAKKAGRRKTGGGGMGKEGKGKGAAERAGAGGHAEKKKKPAAAVSSVTLFAILANLTSIVSLSLSLSLSMCVAGAILQLDNRAFTSDISPYELTLPDLHRGQRRHQAMADAAKVTINSRLSAPSLSPPPRPPIPRESRLLTRFSLSGDLHCAALVVVVGVCRGGQRK